MLALINNLLKVSKIYEYICRPFFLYKYLISENPALNSNSACCIVTIWPCQTPRWGAAGRWGMVSTYGIPPRRDNNHGCYGTPSLAPFPHSTYTFAHVRRGSSRGTDHTQAQPTPSADHHEENFEVNTFSLPALPQCLVLHCGPNDMLMVPRPYLYTNIEDMFPFSTFIYTQARPIM